MDKINKIPVSELEQIQIAASEAHFGDKKILLVGSGGFLGHYFKAYFEYLNRSLYRPCTVVAMDNFIVNPAGRTIVDHSKTSNIIEVEGDISKEDFDFYLDQFEYDYIINCAGCASPASYGKFPLETMAVSTKGTDRLLRTAKRCDARILNFSSSEVLAEPDVIPTPETQIPKIHSMNPRSCYDVTKLYIETASWVMREKMGVNAVVVRPFNVVGWNMMQKDYRVFPSFMTSILNKKPIRVFDPGTQTRSFVWATDFITGCLKVLLHGPSPLYHLGNSDNHVSMIQLAEAFEEVCGTEGLTELVPTNELYKFEPQKRCPSIELARKEIGYNPKITLEEMIAKFHSYAILEYEYDSKRIS